MEQRPNKVREQATLLCGERTFQAESTAWAKSLRWALKKKYCPGVYKKHEEALMAAALVSKQDVCYDLRLEECQGEIRTNKTLIGTLHLILSVMRNHWRISCRAVSGRV